MRRPTCWLLVLLPLFLALPCFAAGSKTIAVVFGGNTEVNRHVFTHLTQALSTAAGGGYKLTAVLDPAKVKPGMYQAVIVVSTKVTSGVEPSLLSFVKSYPAPKEVYLVTLLSRSLNSEVVPFTATNGPAGVDGVSAATTWNRGSLAIHNEWARALVAALAEKAAQ